MKLATVPFGAFCDHRRMRYRTCDGCRRAGGRPCCVECPDCGLGWMLGEGVHGYYFVKNPEKTGGLTE